MSTTRVFYPAAVALDGLPGDAAGPLDGDSLIPLAQIPPAAQIVRVIVANEAAMLALTAAQVQPGDLAFRSDNNKAYLLTAADPSVLGNWNEWPYPVTAGDLDSLSDVTIATPADKQVLVYDGVTDNRWENRALTAADIAAPAYEYTPIAAQSIAINTYNLLIKTQIPTSGSSGDGTYAIYVEAYSLTNSEHNFKGLVHFAMSAGAVSGERWEGVGYTYYPALAVGPRTVTPTGYVCIDIALPHATYMVKCTCVSSLSSALFTGWTLEDYQSSATPVTTANRVALPTIYCSNTIDSAGAVNGASPTEMSRLSGLSSNVQTQLDAKPDISGTPNAGEYARFADADTLEARTTAQVLSDIGAQASDTDLTAIAALTSAADKVPYATGAGTWALADLTAAGRALIDDADAAAQLVTLGVAAAITGTKLDDLTAPDDNTDLNASSTRHGLLPKLSNVATEFLTGQGTWATPASGSNAKVVAAYKSADQSGLATYTYHKVTFPTERIDTDFAFASNTFTAPSTGKYLILFNTQTNVTGVFFLYVNGSRVTTTGRTHYTYAHVSWTYSLTAGQTLDVYWYQINSGVALLQAAEGYTGSSQLGTTELLIVYLGA